MSPDVYIDGFVLAVRTADREAYRQHATDAARLFRKHGAQAIVEGWGDDVPPGKLTSLPMAVQAKDDETVVFSWIVWPSKAARDAGMKAVMADPDTPKTMPFDGQRMIFGGFVPLVVA